MWVANGLASFTSAQTVTKEKTAKAVTEYFLNNVFIGVLLRGSKLLVSRLPIPMQSSARLGQI
jgi:hypothetical protein